MSHFGLLKKHFCGLSLLPTRHCHILSILSPGILDPDSCCIYWAIKQIFLCLLLSCWGKAASVWLLLPILSFDSRATKLRKEEIIKVAFMCMWLIQSWTQNFMEPNGHAMRSLLVHIQFTLKTPIQQIKMTNNKKNRVNSSLKLVQKKNLA